MKNCMIFIGVMLSLSTNVLVSQQQSAFPLGIFTFGGNDVKYIQMSDTLHLNWIQGRAGQTPQLEPIVRNDSMLSVIALEDSVSELSSGQRMEYEAEQAIDPTLLKNYFTEKLTGRLSDDGGARYVEPSVHSANYMVKSAVPDREYRYGRSGYFATFRMKILKNVTGNPAVAACSVWCKTHNNALAAFTLYYNDFPNEQYKDTVVSFLIQQPSGNPPFDKDPYYLAGSVLSKYKESPCKNIDLRVYWLGSVTTWFDKVVIEDSIGHDLFLSKNDTSLTMKARNLLDASGSKVERMYLRDEPNISAFLAQRRVDQVLQGLGYSNLRGRGITAQPLNFERYLLDANAIILMTDNYVTYSNVPSPSMRNDQADAVQVRRYTTNDDYNDSLQLKLNIFTRFGIKLAGEAAKTQGKSFWFIPQLHGRGKESQRQMGGY